LIQPLFSFSLSLFLSFFLSFFLCVPFAFSAPQRYLCPVLTGNQLTHLIIGAAIDIHRSLGPGLLEAVYEECLAKEFTLCQMPFERQKPVPLVYKDLKLECGYRLDFLVDRRIVVELKSIEAFAPIHESVMLTYLRLSGAPIGLLINFNVTVLRDGLRRFVWQYDDTEKDTADALSPQRDAEND